jgi:hypothetical protein
MTANFIQSMELCNINDSENMTEKSNTLDSTSALTWNGAISNPSPDASNETAGRLALFFKSVRGLTDSQLEEYLTKAYTENPRDTFLIAFHIRDCRGGKGERDIGRKALRWLSRDKERFRSIIQYIAEYGRWDDYLTLIQPILIPKPSRKINYLSTENPKIKKKQDTFVKVTDTELINELIQFFASQLEKDIQDMNEGKPCTLAAKWAPTENCSLDRKYDVVSKIIKVLKVSKRNYRKQYLAPLRAYLKVVERYMCHKNWEAIDYSAVPSCAMKRLKKAFAKNDPNRFEEWKAKLTKGEVKVNAKQLYPHELIREVYNSVCDEVSEAQWKVLVEETKKLGNFEKSLVLVDVSGSMGCMSSNSFEPIHVSVALGLIISECAQGPLQNHIITFHENPTFYKIEGNSLKKRIDHLCNAPWGGNTNFQSIFDLILDKAKNFELKQEDMPQTLYILSDMQFDAAISDNCNKTNYQAVLDKYKEAGYQPPKIIFWNLSGKSNDFPCTTNDFGTVMISGFSTAILKSILSLGMFNPYQAMRETIDAERYKSVFDALQPFEPKKTEDKLEKETTGGWLSNWFGN